MNQNAQMNDITSLKKRSLLFFENVTKSYGEKVVLEDIDLAVRPGEFCSLVGPSGCGKSTLLRLIIGEEEPTSGTIWIEGTPAGFPDTTRGIVYQRYPLFAHLTVLENAVLGKRFSTSPWEWIRQRKVIYEEALSYLETVRLADDRHKRPHELSGGMAQRVALVQTLIMKPKILVLDQAFDQLDAGVREHLQVFLLGLWEKYKMTVFFVTHDLNEAVFLGTRIMVLSQYYRGARGARIIDDYKLGKKANATAVKASPEFQQLIQKILREGFDPNYLQDVEEFNLQHDDSFITLSPESIVEEKRDVAS